MIRLAVIFLFSAILPAFAQIYYSIAIPAGSSVSTEIRISPAHTGKTGATVVALVSPSAWTDADLLLEASLDGSVWLPVYDSDGMEYRIKISASRFIVLDAAVFWGLPRIRFRSVAVNGSEAVPQQYLRSLTVIVR